MYNQCIANTLDTVDTTDVRNFTILKCYTLLDTTDTNWYSWHVWNHWQHLTPVVHFDTTWLIWHQWYYTWLIWRNLSNPRTMNRTSVCRPTSCPSLPRNRASSASSSCPSKRTEMSPKWWRKAGNDLSLIPPDLTDLPMFDLFTYIFATLLIPIHITLEQVQPSRYEKIRIYKVLPLSRFNAIVLCMQWCTDNRLIAQLINCVALYIYPAFHYN